MSITLPCPGQVQLAPNVRLNLFAYADVVMASLEETSLLTGEGCAWVSSPCKTKEQAVLSLVADLGRGEVELSKAAALALQEVAKYALERCIYSLYEDTHEVPASDLTTSRPGVTR